MVHVVNGDQLQSLLTVIKYLTKDIEDKEETFEVRGPTAGLVHDFQMEVLMDHLDRPCGSWIPM